MRKKQDFVVKGKRIFVGLEDSKRTWRLCVRCQGMIVHETGLPAEYYNLQAYLRRSYPDCEIKVMYEAGFRGFWLHDLLQQDGIDCVVTPANKVTQEKDNRVKRDKQDARRLALTLENGDYTACWVPDRELREDRQVCRTHAQIQKTIVAFKNRIRKFFDFHGLRIPAGKWSQDHYRRLAEVSLPQPLRLSLDAYLRALRQLEQLAKELKAELERLAEKERYRESVEIKESCPGIGSLSAIRFTLELGDLSRFASGDELGSYLGLTASEYSTGERIHRGKITRQGRGRLRGWLVECAWIAVRRDPALMDKLRQVWRNSGSKNNAIVAVARKLAVRMRAIELKREHYELGVVR